MIVAYFLLQLGRTSGSSALYLYLNLFGAAMVLFSLFFTFNLAAAVIEIFWIAISIYRIWKRKGAGT